MNDGSSIVLPLILVVISVLYSCSISLQEKTDENFLVMDYMDVDKICALVEKIVEELLNKKNIILEYIRKDKKLQAWIVKELKFKYGIPGRQIAR